MGIKLPRYHFLVPPVLVVYGDEFSFNLCSNLPIPHQVSSKPLTQEPDRQKGRSYDRDEDNSAIPSRSESRGRNGRHPSGEEVYHSTNVWGSSPKIPKPQKKYNAKNKKK